MGFPDRHEVPDAGEVDWNRLEGGRKGESQIPDGSPGFPDRHEVPDTEEVDC